MTKRINYRVNDDLHRWGEGQSIRCVNDDECRCRVAAWCTDALLVNLMLITVHWLLHRPGALIQQELRRSGRCWMIAWVPVPWYSRNSGAQNSAVTLCSPSHHYKLTTLIAIPFWCLYTAGAYDAAVWQRVCWDDPLVIIMLNIVIATTFLSHRTTGAPYAAVWLCGALMLS